MRRTILLMLVVVLLCGCSKNADIQPALDLRDRLHQGNGCSFDTQITADFGDLLYTFKMHCDVDKKGNVTFSVIDPETIRGITGVVSGKKGELVFDDKVLAFNTLADGYITPVVSPWVMVSSLSSGYITSCGMLDSGCRISLNDTYEEDALQMDIWLDNDNLPVRCEILYKERRCLTLDVCNFTFV